MEYKAEVIILAFLRGQRWKSFTLDKLRLEIAALHARGLIYLHESYLFKLAGEPDMRNLFLSFGDGDQKHSLEDAVAKEEPRSRVLLALSLLI